MVHRIFACIFVGSDNLFPWPHSKFSLACLYVLYLPLQNPGIFFTQSFSSFRKTCPYHLNLCLCITVTKPSIPSLPFNSLLENLSVVLMPHIHLIILISARWSVNSFSFFTGHISLPCNIQPCTQLVYNFPLIRSETSLHYRFLFPSLE